VLGDLDDAKVLEEEAAKADVVIRISPRVQPRAKHKTYQEE
jgi:hypothetical protein